MKRTYAVLAAGLVAFSAVTAAHAATQDDQSRACRGDAMHFCAADIPNREKITACMKQHLDELSPPCRAMFKGGKKDDAKADAASQ
ncbi:hypothetical protein LMG24238_03742 [Paraburkholderia sediminicola]|uniref:Cysteine rich repeat protein n=1 Tax=Paraburkholderia sediminicola TaxID=458836 RepID=A0A6J5BEX3_9BURK|nr:hypothetical protein [Paraburkholderia sediminicola]CAB3702924.1 hypothetical protein LMG24238_03742 [Paraburkholderia sediminicola]